MTPNQRTFRCIDCGTDVTLYGYCADNDQDICATCSWLRGIEDPVERARLRAFLNKDVVPSITCPRCGLTSYNPNDVKHRFCANCGIYHV